MKTFLQYPQSQKSIKKVFCRNLTSSIRLYLKSSVTSTASLLPSFRKYMQAVKAQPSSHPNIPLMAPVPPSISISSPHNFILTIPLAALKYYPGNGFFLSKGFALVLSVCILSVAVFISSGSHCVAFALAFSFAPFKILVYSECEYSSGRSVPIYITSLVSTIV